MIMCGCVTMHRSGAALCQILTFFIVPASGNEAGFILDHSTGLLIVSVLLALSVATCLSLTVSIACVCWFRNRLNKEVQLKNERSQALKPPLAAVGVVSRNPLFMLSTPPEMKLHAAFLTSSGSRNTILQMQSKNPMFIERPSLLSSIMDEDGAEAKVTVETTTLFKDEVVWSKDRDSELSGPGFMTTSKHVDQTKTSIAPRSRPRAHGTRYSEKLAGSSPRLIPPPVPKHSSLPRIISPM